MNLKLSLNYIYNYLDTSQPEIRNLTVELNQIIKIKITI